MLFENKLDTAYLNENDSLTKQSSKGASSTQSIKPSVVFLNEVHTHKLS